MTILKAYQLPSWIGVLCIIGILIMVGLLGVSIYDAIIEKKFHRFIIPMVLVLGVLILGFAVSPRVNYIKCTIGDESVLTEITERYEFVRKEYDIWEFRERK